MDYDQYYQLRRGKVKAFRALYSAELRRMWFICYHITQDVSKAAPLLLSGWKKVMEQVIMKSSDVPKDSFTALVSAEFFKLASHGMESDEDYETLPIPSVSRNYAAFIKGIEQLPYLAPSGAELGTSYEEGEIDLNDLTKVTVETGMSDGSYMMIESDELTEGDLIVITQITSTMTGSDSEGEDGGFGGMGGFPGGGGMDFGDFDFENFDPSQMPQGGGGFPGMGN